MDYIIENPISGKNLQKLFKSERSSDVEFVLKIKLSDDELKVPAHKAILAASSPVFDRMFFGDLKEGNEVKVEDVSYEGFCEFLQFFYMENIQITDENIFEVYKLVDKYDLSEFLPICERHLADTIYENNLCQYYDIALTFNYSQELIGRLEAICSWCLSSLLKSTSFKNTNQTMLKRILEFDFMGCSETVVFEAVMNWATAACQRKELPISSENLKSELGDCLSLIRFPTMTAEEYSGCLEKYPPLLDHNIFFDIMNYVLVARPLSCAQHFNKTPRKKPFFVTSILRDDSTFEDLEDNRKSMISITASEEVWLHSCKFFLSSIENIEFVKIYVDGEMIQDETSLLRLEAPYSKNTNTSQYRLYFNKPFLCEMDKKYDFCFELNNYLQKYVRPIKGNSSTIRNIKIDSEINYFVKSLKFTVKV